MSPVHQLHQLGEALALVVEQHATVAPYGNRASLRDRRDAARQLLAELASRGLTVAPIAAPAEPPRDGG